MIPYAAVGTRISSNTKQRSEYYSLLNTDFLKVNKSVINRATEYSVRHMAYRSPSQVSDLILRN